MGSRITLPDFNKEKLQNLGESLKAPNKITPYFTIHNAYAFVDFMVVKIGAKVLKLARYYDGKV